MRFILFAIWSTFEKWRVFTYIALGILSALCSFLFINSVTRVISSMITTDISDIRFEYGLLFCFTIIFFVWIRLSLYKKIVVLSQSIFWDLRKRILSLVLRGNYKSIVESKVSIHTTLVTDVNILTQAAMSVIDFSVSFVLAVTCLTFLCYISFALFLITIFFTLIGIIVYLVNSRENLENFSKGRSLENEFLKGLNHILNGYKEIYLDPIKGRSIFEEEIVEISVKARENNISAFTGYLNNQLTGQVLFYLLIVSILLFFSRLLNLNVNDTVSYVFVLIFLLNSIETIMVLIPAINRALVSLKNIKDLKDELSCNLANDSLTSDFTFNNFENIFYKNIQFSYGEGKGAFNIGPIDLTISKGEIVFIYGGNGSGKTTLINCLLGLLIPDKGQIMFDERNVSLDSYRCCRINFSAVFSDFYLFDKFYGIENIDSNKVVHYLELFDLTDTVKLIDNCFSTIDLSTGQKKRLALISSLLEQKPILVLDEWAADQDPYFRQKFYTKILPSLKSEGFTILAITHDDKYYCCADRLYKMDEGMLYEESYLVQTN